MSDKSVVIFSSFWDADSIIDSGFLLCHNKKDQKTYRINIVKPAVNYSIHSIALSHPDLSKKPNMIGMNRIDCFCPTYDLLKRYKSNMDWDLYQKDFTNLIRKRKSVIKEWADSLKSNHVYFLCCWENTSHGAHCHREILYKAFSESKVMSQKIISIYKHGDKIIKKEPSQRPIFSYSSNSNINSYSEQPDGTIIYAGLRAPIPYPVFESDFETETVRGRVARSRIVPRVNPTRRNGDSEDDSGDDF